MKSVRFDPAQEARLEEASRVTGLPVSVLIRQAVDAHCERVLGDRLDRRLLDVIGVVESSGGRARDTGKAFQKTLRKKRRSSAA